MESGRRSSRTARASAPLQPVSHHSSASSNSSGRADRATRSNHKAESPRKSNRSGSLSSEPLDASTPAEDAIQTRRKRGRAEDKNSKAQTLQGEMTNGTEEAGEDDEAVRCICGFDEYPGPPQIEEDNKNGIKEGIEEAIITAADLTEDLAGFFLQCDSCKVWQHGGCVGIMNEDTSPEEYFCEECRKDLHKVFTATNGQRYSHYLPLHQSISRNTSHAASSKDGSPRGSKSGRPSSSLQNAKRRSTMNSRDAAYDEEEQLRRAIEASKWGNGSESVEDGASRRGKRGRSDSVDKPEGPKRQRTKSQTPSPPPEIPEPVTQAESDEGTNGKTMGPKKIRGAAARNHREKEMREEKERQRLEAKQKRMGRAERRRVDDSEAPDETPSAIKPTVNKVTETAVQPPDPPSSQPAPPDSPPTNPAPVSHKKGGRPPNRKGRLGKNQYTKDKDPPDAENGSPNRSQSREVPRDEIGTHATAKGSNHEGKHGKSKSGSKVTMSDMKKRVAAILDFISRTQLELATEPPSPISVQATESLLKGIAGGLPMITLNGSDNPPGEVATDTNGEVPTGSSKEFKDLSCLEMMDVLTRQLVKWQNEFI